MIELRPGYPRMGEPEGVWRPLMRADGTFSATVSCPKCGNLIDLVEHSISHFGFVEPNVRCGCGMDDKARLIAWEG